MQFRFAPFIAKKYSMLMGATETHLASHYWLDQQVVQYLEITICWLSKNWDVKIMN